MSNNHRDRRTTRSMSAPMIEYAWNKGYADYLNIVGIDEVANVYGKGTRIPFHEFVTTTYFCPWGGPGPCGIPECKIHCKDVQIEVVQSKQLPSGQ